MRIIFNAFNDKNKQQHIIGNIEVIMAKKSNSFNNIEFSYELKNGFVFIDHFIEDNIHKSYLYKYCYFDQSAVYGEDIREKPIMLPKYIVTDTGERVSNLEQKMEIKYLPDDDVLYLTFIIPFSKIQNIEDLIKRAYNKALDKLIIYVRENELIRQKIMDIYLNENKIYFLYERIYDYSDNDEEKSYQIKLLGYTTNKELANEISNNGYFSGRDIIVTDEMLKLQNVIIDKPEYVYVEVFYEEDKIEEIKGLKKSAYFSFKFIQPNNECFKLTDPLFSNTMVQYEKDNGHFWFKYKLSDGPINKKELSQTIQDIAIHYIISREDLEDSI